MSFMFHIVFDSTDAINKTTASDAMCGGVQSGGSASAGAGAAAGSSAAVMLLFNVVLDLLNGVVVMVLLSVCACPPSGPPRFVKRVLPAPFVTLVNLR